MGDRAGRGAVAGLRRARRQRHVRVEPHTLIDAGQVAGDGGAGRLAGRGSRLPCGIGRQLPLSGDHFRIVDMTPLAGW